MDLLFLQFGVPVLLVLVLLLAIECGYRLGRRRMRGSDASKALETGAIQGAMLGLLGLLLGFSFAGASSRYMERQDLISQEANAITTAHLRAELLDEPESTELRAALRDYVSHRVRASRALQRGLSPEVATEIKAKQITIWSAARRGVLAKPAVTMAVIGPVNQVIDLHGSRIATLEKHLPALVVGLLLTCSILTLGVIGYACALAKRRNTILTSVIALLIAAALWTTIDLDRPRIGLIRLSDAALESLDLELSARD